MTHPASSRFLRLLGGRFCCALGNHLSSTKLNTDSVKRGFAANLTPRLLAQVRSCHRPLEPMAGPDIAPKKKGRRIRSAGPLLFSVRLALAAVAHEPQQEQEHVDEVEVQVERAHDR